MKCAVGTLAAVALLGGIGAWSTQRSAAPKPSVGTHPGGVAQGTNLASLKPAAGNSLIGFSSGCFWGAEQAFRKVPGIVATAVGYSGGTSSSPSYGVAHRTGHLETVLVEFNPKRTPLQELLKVFWTLPRSKKPEAPASPKSSYDATIWAYDASELKLAEKSREALEKSFHTKLAVRIQPARPFYLAEAYHQQYDEKSGKDLCFASDGP